ncbi:hypothetical protein [Streptomyces sp. SP17KL33]|uniref:hypothetical protein n=1 Tax=Streptomyces sp. SP17KL33 TaxID=3002534 RepID=UPI002E7902C6|nr:hypothetical protein [Streptomyces sp. SP17KL33]MEE1835780.1 hypothetical protein [Streptomyces sp. SP17KL33]
MTLLNSGSVRLQIGDTSAYLAVNDARDLSAMLLSLADEADNETVTETESDPLKTLGDEARDTEYVADRSDIWRAAKGLLTTTGETPEHDDILSLARFLAGDGL